MKSFFRLFLVLMLICLHALRLSAEVKKPVEDLIDKEKPINITSDELEADENNHIVVFKGNVIAKQGDLVIVSETLRAIYGQDGKELEKIVAEENVRVTKGEKVGVGKTAIFYNKDNRIDLIGDAKIWQGKDVLMGEKIYYYLSTGKAVAEPKVEDGRVKATLFPKKDNNAKH